LRRTRRAIFGLLLPRERKFFQAKPHLSYGFAGSVRGAPMGIPWRGARATCLGEMRKYCHTAAIAVGAKGGHFAAWEQPQLLTSEMRAAFKTLRRSA
jgi:hypothetical protein